MTKDVVERAFEPFFTTKEVGKGTGLGLSMIYGFVKQSGGHVKIYSEPDRGTTVKIYLPRLLHEPAPDEDPGHLTHGLEASARQETILVAEDDDDVRSYTVEILRELGYRVLEAHDGPSALRLLERQADPVDLLFTDVVMPGMTGRELAEQARLRQRNLKVLYTSGYTRNAIVHAGRLEPGVEVLGKPFTFEALGQKVRDMLDAGQTRRVLLVEADPTVRRLAAEALRSLGMRVEEAGVAAEALGKVRAAQGRYDAVILDDALPDRSATSLVGELRALHADLALVVTSRSDADQRNRDFASDRCTGVLAHPFSGTELGALLRRLGVECAAGAERN
jgi:CheY-like chemotaxis protein